MQGFTETMQLELYEMLGVTVVFVVSGRHLFGEETMEAGIFVIDDM